MKFRPKSARVDSVTMPKSKLIQKVRKHPRRKIIIVLVVVLLAVSAGLLFKTYRDRGQEPGIDPPGTEKIDLSPATEEEQAEADRHKEALVKQEQQQTSAQSSGRSVPVTIVDASQYGQDVEVRAFATGVYENDATCTITFSRNGQTVTKQVAAEKDSNYMRCGNVVVPRSEFPSAGEWTVEVRYNSASATGSKQQTINVI